MNNLRIKNKKLSTCKNNTRNEKLAKNNKSGVTGVLWDSNANLWQSYMGWW